MTTSVTYPVTAAAGLPETRLSAQLLGRLPDSVAPAPWETRCRVTTWWHKPRRDSLEALPEALRPDRLVAVSWSVVEYSQTPVGPYQEIVAVPIVRGGPVHIPFILVDSPASIVGGRVNWLLPKSLADFRHDGQSVTVAATEPETPAWSVTATTRPLGPPLPFASRFTVSQCSTEGQVGTFAARMRGLARYARVTVTGHADGPLATLLRTGTHHGVVLRRGRFTAGPLRPG